jgi:monofunctional biosynthetic peptidoglycan transglycosylase
MAHRRHQARRPDDLAGEGAVVQQPAQKSLDGVGARRKNSFERKIGWNRHDPTVYGNRGPGQAPAIALRGCSDIAREGKHHYAGLKERQRQGLDEPILDLETEGLAMAPKRKGRSRAAAGPWLRRVVAAAVVLALLPVVLTLLYFPTFVHPVSTLMLKDLATFTGYDRRWVPLDEIAPVLAHSVIMSEDGQFCGHYGIDLGELKVVLDDALAGEATRGASTIPMQTVKNLFLWNGRSVVRKALELPLAVYFDAVLPKRRIMEIYLNIAEWGPNVYGIEAGAQHHFGVSASQLTPRQAALMAAALPNPAARDPARPGPGLKRLANTIQRRAAKSGGYVRCLQ